ncbi:hypothetical protein HAX54_033023 [Datura stramonium]|uniref:Uncharacterized protein n=1 Tax=Datura stramonium TaxID=4076 RepID=A0ABS8VBQ7_DATST|nr:hypothetical protein [Datura stramonium]
MGKKRYKFYEKIPCCLLFFLLIGIASADVLSDVKLVGSDVCKWPGVSCDSSGRVSSINLMSKSVGGQLPPDLNQLSNLQSLNLQKNRLSGSLPPLARLPSLQDVHLDSNNFTFVPPNFLSGLTNLQHFSIDDNPSLPPWTIPVSLTDSPSLADFSASNANIIGQIPDIFGSFPSLKTLRLSYNNITGFLPSSFAMSTRTKFGTIPDLSFCTNLVDLNLRDNSLTGVIPASLISLPKLANVSLQITYSQARCQVSNQVWVNLGNTNHFCNPGPGPCDPQGSVTVINFAKQNWVGTISPAATNLIGLKSLIMNDNNLTGTIPASLATLPELQLVDVSNNNISGKIPNFRSNVIVKTSGNPFIGIDLPPSAPPGRSEPNSFGGTDNSPSASKDEHKSSVSTWVIVAIMHSLLLS